MRVEMPVMSAFFINAKERSTESGRKRKQKNGEAEKKFRNSETKKFRNWSAYALRDSGVTGPPMRCATPA
jgi:hypothetical protein